MSVQAVCVLRGDKIKGTINFSQKVSKFPPNRSYSGILEASCFRHCMNNFKFSLYKNVYIALYMLNDSTNIKILTLQGNSPITVGRGCKMAGKLAQFYTNLCIDSL